MRMRNIRKTLPGIIIIVTALTLCGCRRNTIDIDADLPAGGSIDILVKIDENDEDFCDKYADVLKDAEDNLARQYEIEYNTNVRNETLTIMNSDRYKYCEGGWRSAYYFCQDVYGVSETGLDYKNSGEDSTIEFADRFGSIKIMEYNANGIVNVSDEVVIAPKDKYGVGRHISYSSETGTAECDKFVYRRWQGITPDAPIVLEVLLAFPSWIIFLVMLAFMRKKYQPGSDPDGWIVGASLLSVPNIAFTVNSLVLKFVPYLNINDSRFSVDDLMGIALIDIPWAACIFVFVMRVRKGMPKTVNEQGDSGTQAG